MFYSIPPKNGFLAPKWPNLAQNWHFQLNIGTFGQMLAIFGPLGPMPDQKPMQTRCLGGFYVMWVPKPLIAPKNIRIFAPKTTKFGPKLGFLAKYRHFWSIWSHALPKDDANKMPRCFFRCVAYNWRRKIFFTR